MIWLSEYIIYFMLLWLLPFYLSYISFLFFFCLIGARRQLRPVWELDRSYSSFDFLIFDEHIVLQLFTCLIEFPCEHFFFSSEGHLKEFEILGLCHEFVLGRVGVGIRSCPKYIVRMQYDFQVIHKFYIINVYSSLACFEQYYVFTYLSKVAFRGIFQTLPVEGANTSAKTCTYNTSNSIMK